MTAIGSAKAQGQAPVSRVPCLIVKMKREAAATAEAARTFACILESNRA
jgi:hypothetical protein